MSRTAGTVWASHQAYLSRYHHAEPCAGALRIEEDDGRRPFTVRCDECGALLGVHQEAGDRPPREGAPAAKKADEEWPF